MANAAAPDRVEAIASVPSGAQTIVRVLLKRFKFKKADLKRLNGLHDPITITSNEVAQNEGVAVRWVKDMRRAIEDHYQTVKAPILKLGRVVDGWRTADLAPWTAAEQRIGDTLVAWNAAEAQRIERERLEREEAAKRDAEAKRQEEIAALQRVADQEQSPAVKAAIETEAQALADAPLPTPSVDAPARPKIPGVSFYAPRYWTRVDSFERLVLAVAAPIVIRLIQQNRQRIKALSDVIVILTECGTMPPHVLSANRKTLDTIAQQAKGDLTIPGVTILSDQGSLAGRRLNG